MCLYPKLIKNPKYKPNKKNQGVVPELWDIRMMYVPVACGKCEECRRAKRREWQIRLTEELKTNKGYFITLTLKDDTITKILADLELPRLKNNENTVAKTALRRLLERVRKETKKSIKHWCVTELGETNDRIHLHGIFFGEGVDLLVSKHWHDILYIGEWCDLKTINYITKYMLKVDDKHPLFTQKILCSAGLGKEYINSYNATTNKYKNIDTKETYRLPNGQNVPLPIYYRNKIYTDAEKEMLWYNKIDKGERWINGVKFDANDHKAIETELIYNQRIKAQTHHEDIKAWDIARYINAIAKYKAKYKKLPSITKIKEFKYKYLTKGIYTWRYSTDEALTLNARASMDDYTNKKDYNDSTRLNTNNTSQNDAHTAAQLDTELNPFVPNGLNS